MHYYIVFYSPHLYPIYSVRNMVSCVSARGSLVILFTLYVSVSQGITGTYYVAPNGTAAWTECTAIERPCSQATAKDSAKDADLVYYLPGTYTETILFFAHGVTALSYEKHGAVINNSKLNYGLYSNTDRVTFDGFTVYVPNGGNAGIKINPDAEDCKIINNRIIGVNDNVFTYGIRAENGGGGLVVSGNEITAVSQGIGFSSVSGFSGLCRDNYIHSFSSYANGSDGIKFSGGGDFTEFVVEHNEITGWHQDAIDLFGGSNVMVRYNYIHHCSGLNAGNGIKGGGASRDNNTIYGNYLVESGDRETGYGIASNSGDNLVIAYNIVIGFNYGIAIFSGDDNPKIVNNYIQSPNRGIVIGNVKNLILVNNIMNGKNYDLKFNNTNEAITKKNIHVNFPSTYDSLNERYNVDDDIFQTDPKVLLKDGRIEIMPDSPVIDVGIPLEDKLSSGFSIDSVFPDHMVIYNQNNSGKGWEIGAFVYHIIQPPSNLSINY